MTRRRWIIGFVIFVVLIGIIAVTRDANEESAVVLVQAPTPAPTATPEPQLTEPPVPTPTTSPTPITEPTQSAAATPEPAADRARYHSDYIANPNNRNLHNPPQQRRLRSPQQRAPSASALEHIRLVKTSNRASMRGRAGTGTLDSCYWERLSGATGDFSNLIANKHCLRAVLCGDSRYRQVLQYRLHRSPSRRLAYAP